MNPYEEAHLFVAAIRVLFHKKPTAPPIEEVSGLLDISTESALSISRKLEKAGIIEIYSDPFSTKVAIADHLAIEQLPKEDKPEKSLAGELEQFMSKKQNMDKKVENIQAELEAKKKKQFEELEAQLKKKMQK